MAVTYRQKLIFYLLCLIPVNFWIVVLLDQTLPKRIIPDRVIEVRNYATNTVRRDFEIITQHYILDIQDYELSSSIQPGVRVEVQKTWLLHRTFALNYYRYSEKSWVTGVFQFHITGLTKVFVFLALLSSLLSVWGRISLVNRATAAFFSWVCFLYGAMDYLVWH